MRGVREGGLPSLMETILINQLSAGAHDEDGSTMSRLRQ